MNYEQIRNYSSYQQYTYWTRGTNISGIIDAMLRVTTKITENYASDIIYEIEKLKDAVEKNKAFHVLLTFRENGVDDYSVLYDMSKFATSSRETAMKGFSTGSLCMTRMAVLLFFDA